MLMENSQGLGKRGEQSVYGILRKHMKVSWHKYGPFDFSVGELKLEMKTSKMRRGEWKFNLHRHGTTAPIPSFYVLRLEGIPYVKNKAVHLLVPGEVGLKTKTIELSIRSLLDKDSRYALAFKSFLKNPAEFS